MGTVRAPARHSATPPEHRTPPRRLSHLVLLLACLLAPTVTSRAQEAEPRSNTADLPVTRLVLFTSGVGYFEHSGTVSGDAELRLAVPERDMNDLLQSLVLQDFGGGTVRPVRYPSRDPLGRILTSYSLDLSGDPTLAGLLTQARGERVEVEASQPFSGRIVNVERVMLPEEEPVTYLTLATSAGLRRVDLSEVSAIRFTDASIQSELEAALVSLTRYRSEDDQQLRLSFDGEGERRVSVAYVREMPVWKSSYRLLLGEGDRADLQGWAILDNPTDMDLEEVTVSFVAGQPISFVSNLFEPLYVERERLDLADERSESDGRSRLNRQMEAARDMATMQLAAPAAAPQLSGAGVAPMATAGRTGATFAYRVEDPVSVNRHESAMIPIVGTTVEANRFSVYSPLSQSAHPLRAVRLQNDTGLHLAPGPVTIFGEGGFTGNAFLSDLIPGGTEMLAYAVDLDLAVTTASSAEPEEVVAVAIHNGVLETSHRQRVTTTYEVDLRGEGSRFLVIEHPRRDGYEVVLPDTPPVVQDDSHRFGIELMDGQAAPGPDREIPTHQRCARTDTCTLTVVQERELSRTVAFDNVSSQQIAFYLENVALSDEDRESLHTVLEIKRELTDLDRRTAALREQVDVIFRDQQRIRENMAQLDRNSTLYRRYLTDIEGQEDELDVLRESLESLEEQRREVQGRLDALLASF